MIIKKQNKSVGHPLPDKFDTYLQLFLFVRHGFGSESENLNKIRIK